MEYRYVGNSDLRVSVVGLGCNNFGGRLDLDAARAVVHRALDRGVNHFDTADMYGRGKSEEFLGEILKPRRKDVVLATKFGAPLNGPGTNPGASRKYIVSAVEASLRRLSTDYIDLYYQHYPDSRTPMEETLRALDDLVREGKVRCIGNSNFSARQLVEADDTANRSNVGRFICAQDELSLLSRQIENESLPIMRERKLALIPYYPLAGGLLTGKYRRGVAMSEDARLVRIKYLADRFLTAPKLDLAYRIIDFCDAHQLDVLNVAFAWLLKKPDLPSVIASVSSPEQLDANISAAESKLSDAERAALDALTAPAVKDAAALA